MVNSLSVPAARDEGDFWKLLDERIDTSGHARVRGGEITEITLSLTRPLRAATCTGRWT